MASVPTLDDALAAWADHDHAVEYQLRHGTVEVAAIRATAAAAAAQVALALSRQDPPAASGEVTPLYDRA